jgi:hypothetical protein
LLAHLPPLVLIPRGVVLGWLPPSIALGLRLCRRTSWPSFLWPLRPVRLVSGAQVWPPLCLLHLLRCLLCLLRWLRLLLRLLCLPHWLRLLSRLLCLLRWLRLLPRLLCLLHWLRLLLRLLCLLRLWRLLPWSPRRLRCRLRTRSALRLRLWFLLRCLFLLGCARLLARLRRLWCAKISSLFLSVLVRLLRLVQRRMTLCCHTWLWHLCLLLLLLLAVRKRMSWRLRAAAVPVMLVPRRVPPLLCLGVAPLLLVLAMRPLRSW